MAVDFPVILDMAGSEAKMRITEDIAEVFLVMEVDSAANRASSRTQGGEAIDLRNMMKVMTIPAIRQLHGGLNAPLHLRK